MQPLIDRGHDVTIVTTLPLENIDKRYRHIQLDVPPLPKEFMSGMIKDTKGFLGGLTAMKSAIDFGSQHSNLTLQDPRMKRLMAEEKFDLVILGFFLNLFQLGVAASFKCPVVLSLTQRAQNLINDFVGNPTEVFYVPHMRSGLNQPLSFFERVKNVIVSLAIDKGFASYIDYRMELLYNYNFPPEKFPSYEEMLKNVSLVLTISHFSEGVIRPDVPAIVEVAGIQVKPKPEELPKVSHSSIVNFNGRCKV
ncbi:unnamed protein product [Hermetia illucens]|uniref:Uncharacterized protein n=1 Tax=Hermetia illucens TaxID=343691 RepID=A0A7R8UCN6_HERIL|nr:unnamed protein product [Hermetia illucens]